MRVESTHVAPDLLEATLVFDPGEPLRTSEVPGLATTVIELLPGLKGHRCRNDAALGFADELHDTELAHLVEHAALEIMAMAGSPESLRGATTWDAKADGPGVFHVRMGWDDDLVALGSLRCACALVSALASGEAAPNVTAEARRLRGLRGR